ncbi:MAG: DUF4153 domain-containing protein [Pseudomonadota bacterium]|nr:DUF4153 domain-containing protein [Pseudomonadota bacterium]
MTTGDSQKPGSGFVLTGLLVGLATGFAAYAFIEFWADRVPDETLPQTILGFIAFSAAAFLLLAERGAMARAIPAALLIAAVITAPTYFMLRAGNGAEPLDQFPIIFWFLVGGPLSAYLMTTLAKAALLDRIPPAYPGLFFHGLTLPLIAGGGGLFALLSLVLLYTWAGLLRSMDVDFFHNLFQEPWFILPFVGAVGGLSVAMIRSLDSALGALRVVLLLFCRIAMPITAVFSVTLVIVLLVNGADAIFARGYPGAVMLALAFAGMLVFNGVYQNGEGGPPPAWLRLATIVALAIFPVYAVLAAWAFWIRIGDYGLTPPRVIGLAMNALAALYSIVCVAGLLTEFNWRGKKWMKLVAPFNTAMATVWIVVLLALATPLADPWAISARSQSARLLSGKTSAEKFDFSYLRFRLGDAGKRELEKLARTPNSHPDALAIRTGATRALSAASPWILENGAPDASPSPESDAGPHPGFNDLEFNPEGADPEPAAGEPDGGN